MTETRRARIASLPPESDYGPRELRARRMYEAGYVYKEIAAELGVSVARAGEMVIDPKRESAMRRKAKYNGTCRDCGKETVADGPGNIPERCRRCSHMHSHESRKWTPEAIVDAIRRWTSEAGKPPTSVDWNVAHHNRSPESAERLERGDYPAATTVQTEFGRWRDAILAAGFDAPESSTRDEFQEKCAEAKRLYEHGFTVTRIAQVMGISHSNASYRLGAAGVEKYVPMYEKAGEYQRRANERRRAA